MSKTPISILQELVVQKRERLPDYYIENCSNVPGVSFKCTVKVCSIKAVGYAATKKEAKQNSAKKALEMLGYSNNSGNTIILEKEITLLVNCSAKPGPFINYVGKLNELASTHNKPYPTYHDEPLPNANGIFVTHCNFLKFSAEGYGLKKKDSKQHAAQNMLEKMRNKDISLIITEIENLHHEKSKKLESLTREVIKNYEKLTVTVHNDSPRQTVFPPIPDLKKRVFSLESLGKELEKYGYKYTIETFQKKPYIMMMKICETNATVMGKGDSKQEALNDLYENILIMFDNGFSLKTAF